MIFDFQQIVTMGGIISFPDYQFAAYPLNPSQVGETITLQGSDTGTTQSVGGTVDQRDF